MITAPGGNAKRQEQHTELVFEADAVPGNP
jgi:hypothetical protein